MNFTRIAVLAAVARDSGRVLRSAKATTCWAGAIAGGTAGVEEAGDSQRGLGVVAESRRGRDWIWEVGEILFRFIGFKVIGEIEWSLGYYNVHVIGWKGVVLVLLVVLGVLGFLGFLGGIGFGGG
ncbi:MAG: hypothetical protein Q8N47_07335 [Bryobacterales bacterium]|nr:hypothetical protein [Bryobacterales bacterium]